MKTTTCRRAALGAISLAVLGGSALVAAPAQAQEVESGSVAFSGDDGDWITGGRSYSYAIDDGDQLGVHSDNGSMVRVSVSGYNGDWWHLSFDAPEGETLAAGTYEDATRYPFNGVGPGLSLSGNGRGCNTLTGSFTVNEAVFGPEGYVQTFDASFEQHCGGGTAAARGEVHISNPPPPPVLELDLAVAEEGEVSRVTGAASVSGTVTCNKPSDANVSGTVVQVVKKTIVRGSFATQVTCEPGAPAAWTATASPDGTIPFRKGDVEVDARAYDRDDDYGQHVSVDSSAIVDLDKAKKDKTQK